MALVEEYRKTWPKDYLRIRGYILSRLLTYESIEHIGSTAIPGMVAKPIIDIMIAVPAGEMARTIEELAQLEYRHQGDLGIVGREAFDYLPAHIGLPRHHLYACYPDNPQLTGALAFRNFLTENSEWRRKLSDLKMDLDKGHAADRKKYMEGKKPLVEEIIAIATKSYSGASMAKLRGFRVVLIGGTSHSGKSTLAQALAAQLGWSHRSTDKLARHPGRPWALAPKVVPAHVAEHYLLHPVDALVADVLRHYRNNVWPLVEDIITEHATKVASEGLVLEGSALWPELVAALKVDRVAAIWLTADDTLLRQRIQRESGFETKSPQERLMIEKFLGRTLRYNELMMDALRRHGLAWIDVSGAEDPERLRDKCMAAFSHWRQAPADSDH